MSTSISKIFQYHLVKYLIIGISSLMISSANSAEYKRVIVDGKEIILDTNGTWKEAPQINGSCTELMSSTVPVSYCLSEAQWKRSTSNDTYELTFNYKTSEIYAGIIAEKAYIPVDNFRKIIISNAEEAASLKGVKIIRDFEKEFMGQKWRAVEFTANVSGLDVQFVIFYNSEPKKGSVQFVFYTSTENAVSLNKSFDNFWIKFN